MSLLENYEAQYAALIAEITSCISRIQQKSGAERNEISNKINNGLGEAQELIEQIGLEIREIPVNQRQSFTSRFNCAKVELERLKTEYRKIRDQNRRQLLGYTATVDLNAAGDADYFDDVSITNDQRQRLLENSELIERTGYRLTEGYRLVLETEAVGAQVLNDLQHQRETIQSARSRLRETNAELGRASRTVNSMILRAMREKVILYAVGFCFALAVGISLYLTFSSSSAPSA